MSKIKKLARHKAFFPAVAGLLAGIVLLLWPSDSKTDESRNAVSADPTGEYCALLESKAESLIGMLDGVKECRVFITLSEGYEYAYASDQRVRGSGDAREVEKTYVLAAESNPVLLRETPPVVAGVAVVCRGASYETQYRIIELMCALFNIGSNRISVQTG